MDRNSTCYDNMNYSHQLPVPVNSMANSSMILAIVGAVSTFVLPFYLPCIFGSIAIMMALLSRGQGPMSSRARFGLLLSIFTILINIIILITGLFMFLTNPELRAQVDEIIGRIQGFEQY